MYSKWGFYTKLYSTSLKYTSKTKVHILTLTIKFLNLFKAIILFRVSFHIYLLTPTTNSVHVLFLRKLYSNQKLVFPPTNWKLYWNRNN